MPKKKNTPQKDWSPKPRCVHPEEAKRKEAALEISESLSINLSDELKKKLSLSIDYYLYSINDLDPPRKSEKRKALEELYKISEQFISVVSNFENPNLNKALWEHEYSRSLLFRPENTNLRNDALRTAKVYNDAAFFALHDLPIDKGGPSSNYTLKTFIIHLAEIYKEATEKKPTCYHVEEDELYKGDFLTFAFEILKALGKEPDSPDDLGPIIIETLKKIR